MLTCSIEKRLLARAAPHHRELQAAIAVLANRRLGIETEPQGIGRFEGGVVVNGREITIKNGLVTDGRLSNDASEEEKATVVALGEAIALWHRGGVDALREVAGGQRSVPGDPLRSLLGLC